MKRVLNIRLQGRKMIEVLEAEASRLGCDSRQLIVALLAITTRDSMVDSILDGDDPALYAPHYAISKPKVNGGVRQLELLEWLMRRADGDGKVSASLKQIATDLDVRVAVIHATGRSLERKGRLKRIRPEGRTNVPTTWQILPHKMEDAA